MKELTLLGRSPDADLLVLVDEHGQEYALEINNELRSSLTDPNLVPVDGSPMREELSPRLIQQLLREGFSPAEIASHYGEDLQKVTRFQAPVLAEMNHAIQTLLTSPLGQTVGSPSMGDTVINRLGQRGVDVENLSWSALREGRNPWQVAVNFYQEGLERTAVWELRGSGNTPIALNEEAKNLTENSQEAAPVTALFEGSTDRPAELNDEEASRLLERQEALLERLNAARGKRLGQESVSVDNLENGSSTSEHNVVEFPTRGGASEEQPDPSSHPSGKKRPSRRPMPSWDEIVFGHRDE